MASSYANEFDRKSESALLEHWDIINNKDHQKPFIMVVHLFILSYA